MATIAVLNIGLGGHVGPATRLGAVLVRQGHRVLAWAPEACREQVEATGAEFCSHEPTHGPVGGLVDFAAVLAEAAEHSCEELIERLFEEQVDLVIHDCHVPWGRIAAEFLGLPRIISHPLFPGSSPPMPDVDDLPEPLRAGSVQAAARVLDSRLSIARKWGIELGDWRGALVSTGEATIGFTTEVIVGGLELEPGWRLVGPLMDPAEPPIAAPGRPLVYAAFGTFFNYRREPFQAVVDALADEPVDVLISTGRSPVSPSDLGPLPPNVVVREFVDSREVLASATVHVTHGGCSSVHESLLAGVPMVCIPQGSDQIAWSRRLEALGAGAIVDMTPAAIRTGVHRLIGDCRPREHAAELGEHLAAYDGEPRLAKLVEQMLSGRYPGVSAGA
jgi:MGT family glycosyltransferase